MVVRSLFLYLGLACAVPSLRAENWPAWRGPSQQGVTSETDLPVLWSRTENIRWRTPLPERGNSTPIVWEDRIFVTQPEDQENRRTLMCFDRAAGKLLWQEGLTFAEKEPTHNTNPFCSPSPVTDGERVIVWFGSAGLACYDLAGKLLWHRDLGSVNHHWGSGSSPVLVGNLCIINYGPGNPSFVIAVDKRDGNTVWKFDVPHEHYGEKTALGPSGSAGGSELYGSWATPLVIDAAGRKELIVALPQKLLSCDPETGKEFWSCGGLSDLVYASPSASNDIVVAFGGFHGPSLAVKAGGRGDRTVNRLWYAPRSRSRLPSAVVRDEHLYVADMQGIVECQHAGTGETVWEGRAKGTDGKNETWSSPVLSGDKLYLPNQSGDVFVIKASPQKLEVIATNSLSEPTNSSLAVSNGEIFFRTHEALWCIGED